MSVQEFEQLSLNIESNTFPGPVADPVHFGIARGKLEREKLQRLINLGAKVRSSTVQSQVQQWKRQVKRLDSSIARLQKLKEEIESSRVKLEAPKQNDNALPCYRRLRVE